METALCGVVPVVIGYWLNPADPLSLAGPFPWLLFGVLLPSLRYGTAFGVTVTAGYVALFGLSDHPFPRTLSLALVICAVLCGAFTDQALRRQAQLAYLAGLFETRLEAFTRVFHILKLSHDRLEQWVAADSQSLHSSVMRIRDLLVAPPGRQGALRTQGIELLRLLVRLGSLQAAALYECDRAGGIIQPPIATVGSCPPVSEADPLVARALESNCLVSVRPPQEEASPVMDSPVLAVLPLVDVTGRRWGLVVIFQIPFVMFHQENLNLLAALGGHIGDLLNHALPGADQQVEAEAEFHRHLARSLHDRKHYGIVSSLVRVRILDRDRREALRRFFLSQLRGTDYIYCPPSSTEPMTLWLLLPMTDEAGLEGYRARINRALKEQEGLTLEHESLSVTIRVLQKQDSVESLMAWCAGPA